MENAPNSDEPPRSKSEIAGIVRRLSRLIGLIPYDDLIRRCSLDLGLAAPLELPGIRDQLSDLTLRARIGDRSAIIGLRDLGLEIIDTLELLLTQNRLADEPKSPLAESPPPGGTHRESTETIADVIGVLCRASSTHLNEVAITLEESIGTALEVKSDSVASDPSLSISKDEIQMAAENPTNLSTRILVESIVQFLVTHRLLNKARRVTFDLAKNSLRWPMSLGATKDALKDDLDRFDQITQLGSNLPFRLYPKGGQKRFEHGSPSAFALGICLVLEKQRRAGQSYSVTRIEELKEAERQHAEDPEAPTNWTAWLRKATLLPEFSSESRTRTLWLEV